jgi:hypothetical protein
VTKVTVTKVTSRLWKAPDLTDDASSIISDAFQYSATISSVLQCRSAVYDAETAIVAPARLLPTPSKRTFEK